jgi:hypothetical protein
MIEALNLLTIDGVAKMVHLRPDTIRHYNSMGKMPPPDFQVGRTPVWRPSTILAWDATRRTLDANTKVKRDARLALWARGSGGQVEPPSAVQPPVRVPGTATVSFTDVVEVSES